MHQAYHDDIYGPYVEDIARHILNLDIDTKIQAGDLSIVPEIANLDSKNQKWNLLGFASKYCNFHNLKAFPIYNSRMKDILSRYLGMGNNQDLDNYTTFCDVLKQFTKDIDADKLNYKELDKFIWLHRENIRNKVAQL